MCLRDRRDGNLLDNRRGTHASHSPHTSVRVPTFGYRVNSQSYGTVPQRNDNDVPWWPDSSNGCRTLEPSQENCFICHSQSW